MPAAARMWKDQSTWPTWPFPQRTTTSCLCMSREAWQPSVFAWNSSPCFVVVFAAAADATRHASATTEAAAASAERAGTEGLSHGLRKARRAASPDPARQIPRETPPVRGCGDGRCRDRLQGMGVSRLGQPTDDIVWDEGHENDFFRRMPSALSLALEATDLESLARAIAKG